MCSIVFLIFIFSSLLIDSHLFFSIYQNCLTDDDCDLEFECRLESQLCSCPLPYFWNNETSHCVACPSIWFTYEQRKCFLISIFDVSKHLLTWIEAQTICQHYFGELFSMTTINEFQFIKDQIEFGIDAFTTPITVWIDLPASHDSSVLFPWCDPNEERTNLSCIQIEFDMKSNACLRSVSCLQKSHFICQSLPRNQLDLQMDQADSEERALPLATTKKTIATTRATIRTTVTTKRPTGNSNVNINSIGNAIVSGINVAGQISNALSNNLQGNSNGMTNGQVAGNLINTGSDSYGPLAQADTNQSKFPTKILIFVGIGIAVLVIIGGMIFFVCTCLLSSSRLIRHEESPTSLLSVE